jgi:hypothetical protein
MNGTSSVTDSPRPGQAHRERLCWLSLGWTRGNLGALHAQGVHCEQYNICRSPKETSASCNQVQTMRTSEYRCFVATRQCSAPYCPFNCCNNPRSVLPVSSTSAVLARPRPQWLSCLWTAQRGDGRQVFQVRRRGAAGCALSQKTLFPRGIHALPKRWNTCMVRNGDYVGKWSHCVPSVLNKLRDTKYLKFSFDSPTHFVFTCPMVAGPCAFWQLSSESVTRWNSHINMLAFINEAVCFLCGTNWIVTYIDELVVKLAAGGASQP